MSRPVAHIGLHEYKYDACAPHYVVVSLGMVVGSRNRNERTQQQPAWHAVARDRRAVNARASLLAPWNTVIRVPVSMAGLHM